MAAADRTPTPCPTCSKVLLGPSAIRYHHAATHDLSLTGVAQDRWSEYVTDHADQIENPEGTTFRERDRAPRHPAYTGGGDHDRGRDRGGEADGTR